MKACFFCPAPFLDLALIFDRIRDSIEPLREHQLYRPARLRISPECSVVVLSDPDFKRRASCSDVITAVGTSEDIR
jgi:hypothetical protein